jgi:hypothetical protein
MRFSHNRCKHGGNAIFRVKTQRNVVSLSVSSHEVMRFAAVIVNIDQTRSEQQAFAIDHSALAWNAGRFLRNPNCGDGPVFNEQGAVNDKIRKDQARVLKKNVITRTVILLRFRFYLGCSHLWNVGIFERSRERILGVVLLYATEKGKATRSRADIDLPATAFPFGRSYGRRLCAKATRRLW